MAASILGKRTRHQMPVTPSKRRVVQLQTPVATPTKSILHPKSTPKSTSPYSPAKSVLRRSAPAQIVGRQQELKELADFMDNKHAGLLYLCGPPGTGKSATVTHFTIQQSALQSSRNLRIININCVSLKKPEHIYEQILVEMTCKGNTFSNLRDCLERLDGQGDRVLLVLDEVDYLSSASSKVIYSLFELGASLHLKIIAIANALNLTDSLLPHLRATGLDPAVLRFKPYLSSEITEILASRISEISLPSGTSKFIEPNALDFIGRKVANATGDIRKALDILRRSVESVESEYRSALSEVSGNGSPPGRKLQSVTIKHVSKVASAALNSGSTPIASLAIHEKAILATMVVRKTGTIDTTYDAYTSLCNRDKLLTPLSKSEFSTVCSGMTCHGFLNSVAPRKRGVPKADGISLGVSEMDVLKGIGEIGILKRFFD